MRPEEQEGKAQPRLCSAFLLHPRTNPALEFPSVGRMGMAKGQPCWATHTQHLCTPVSEHARVHWRHPAAQRPRRWQGWTLPFSLKAKYLLPRDPPRGAVQGGRAEWTPRNSLQPSSGVASFPELGAGFDPAGTRLLNVKHVPNPAMQPGLRHAPPPQHSTGI